MMREKHEGRESKKERGKKREKEIFFLWILELLFCYLILARSWASSFEPIYCFCYVISWSSRVFILKQDLNPAVLERSHYWSKIWIMRMKLYNKLSFCCNICYISKYSAACGSVELYCHWSEFILLIIISLFLPIQIFHCIYLFGWTHCPVLQIAVCTPSRWQLCCLWREFRYYCEMWIHRVEFGWIKFKNFKWICKGNL